MKISQIAAIILAAGQGSRAGQAKWKLKTPSGKIFLDTIVTNLLQTGVTNIGCVVRSDSIPDDPRVNLVQNPHPELGMFSSIHCGVNKFCGAEGYMIFPVDHPYVDVTSIRHLLRMFIQHSDQVVYPVYGGSAGHPIIIPNKIARKISFTDYTGGLRQFLLDQHCVLHEVEVADKNILRNVNYLSD